MAFNPEDKNEGNDAFEKDVNNAQQSENQTAESKVFQSENQNADNTAPAYSSYEWNANGETAQGGNSTQNTGDVQDGYYRYTGSQINSNPTDYTTDGSQQQTQSYYGSYTPQADVNPYGAQQGQSTQYQPYNAGTANQPDMKSKREKKKKEKKPLGRGALAAAIAICIIASGAVGFGGGLVANSLNNSGSNGGVTINKVVTSVDKTSSDSATAELSTTQIADMTADSVVEITTEIVQTGGFSHQYITSGAGSGVIISENGYIITNNHVIEDASKITITLRDGTSYTATLVGTDSTLDVALLKIDATGLTAATFGDSDKLKVGDKAVAIGNPLGQLGGTVTDGIISSLSRNVVIDDVTMNLLQTNAAINPGNSGGGLFNAQGELIGIVVAKSSGNTIEGLGFAIPVNHITGVLEDLTEYGYVRGRIDLGMSLLDITSSQMAMMYGVSETGCYISSVDSNSNAASAGFNSGDRIISINGTEVSSAEDVNNIISKLSVGDTAVFKLQRGNQTGELSLTFEEDVPDFAGSGNSDFSNSFSSDSNSNSESGGNSFNSIFDYFGW